ncbi:MAG: serine/threonine protein kinase, partial [Deltaproteobacteria bacterium]|nr:serine/threonine protein kinase [Deltaproteobacteria bacterium]
MAAGHSSRNDTLTKGQADRLPFPLGLYWLRAQQATRPADVYKAAEAVVRVLAAPLLADVLGSEWPAELEKMLRGEGSGRPPLEAPGFGTRISLLRLLVKAHAGVSAPLLAGVQEWWAAVDGEQGPLNRLVQGRNGEAHGAAHGSESQWKVEKAQALGLLGTVLRGASFLRETQWVHLDGDAAQRRGKMVGKLWRLDGTGPYGMLPKDAEWPPSFALERDFVYLGSADGTTWKLMPFVLLHDGTVGHPLPVVLDTIDRRGRLKFLEPVSGKEVERALPGEDWAETTWTAFLDNRRALAEAWALRLEAPHAGFAVKVEADLADGLKPGAVLEDYRLVQKLGEGGAAVVWEAEDVHDGTSCALKVLKGEMAANETEVSRFEEEIRRLKKLANDGCRRVVKPVFSFRVQHGDTRRVVLRMPLYKGTLKEHAANLRATSGNAPPSEKELASWARMALEALAELHARGVVHRDVKSSNFLLNDAGELVISDFGIAREEASRAGLTKTGDLLGTQLYMAPEQLRSAKTVTAAADMYALAVSLDELWSGEPRVTPGKGMEGTLGELLRAMSSQDPEARPTAAQALEKLGGVAVSAPAARGVTGSHPVVSAPVAATPA